MKFNIVSAAIFICVTTGFFIFKQFYLESLYFNKPDEQVIEKIRNNNDIEHLKSIVESLVAIDTKTSKSYNDMLTNAVDVYISLSLLAAILSIGALLETKQKSKHSNKSLKHGTREKPRAP